MTSRRRAGTHSPIDPRDLPSSKVAGPSLACLAAGCGARGLDSSLTGRIGAVTPVDVERIGWTAPASQPSQSLARGEGQTRTQTQTRVQTARADGSRVTDLSRLARDGKQVGSPGTRIVRYLALLSGTQGSRSPRLSPGAGQRATANGHGTV